MEPKLKQLYSNYRKKGYDVENAKEAARREFAQYMMVTGYKPKTRTAVKKAKSPAMVTKTITIKVMVPKGKPKAKRRKKSSSIW